VAVVVVWVFEESGDEFRVIRLVNGRLLVPMLLFVDNGTTGLSRTRDWWWWWRLENVCLLLTLTSFLSRLMLLLRSICYWF
jgi:hypothetical protein